jgi:sarcosine oxidase
VRAVAAALDAAGCSYELLSPAAAHERHPELRIDTLACVSADTGRIRADVAWQALLDGARRAGARIEAHTAVQRLTPRGDSVALDLGDRTLDARCAVVAAGSWVSGLLDGIVALPPLEITEEHVFHFAPRGGDGGDGTGWPSFIHYRHPHPAYGLFTPGEGVKVALHHAGRRIGDPRRRADALDPDRRAAVLRYVEEWIPGVEPVPVTEATCLYTTTPNDDFVLDRRGPIVVASACSGHGFKFAPLAGELVADLVEGRAVEYPRFSLPR